MNLYKHIRDSETVLKTLINEAKTSNNKVVRLKELNVLIGLHNSYKEILENKYYTDYFDILILNRLYQTLLQDQNSINLNEFLIHLDSDIRTGKDYVKSNIIGFLQGMQLDNSLKKGKVFQDSEQVWSKVVDNLLSQVKEKIVFNKKFK